MSETPSPGHRRGPHVDMLRPGLLGGRNLELDVDGAQPRLEGTL